MSTGFLKSALLISGVLVAAFAAGCQNDTGSTSGLSIPNTSATSPPLSGSGGTSTTSNPTPTGTTTSTPTPTPTVTSTVGLNLLSITVGGSSLCGGNLNQPCASVVICSPGTNTCQTISNLLVDTGSYGLRIFSSAISVPLTQVTNASGTPVAECAQFGTGSDWGPVMMASVQVASEPFVTLPIQVINSSFSVIPSSSGCTSPDTSPSTAGFNGILGVGLFTQDCGSSCVSSGGNGPYYACSGNSCTVTPLALNEQVQNPIALLPFDNNGVVMNLSSVPASGTTSLNGTMYLGIGTQANNTPSGVTTYLADGSGEFNTKFSGSSTTYSQSFIDSGSNGLFFPTPSGLVSCSSSDTAAPGWFCPASTTNFTAMNSSYNGSTSGNVTFSIANAHTLFSSGNEVFNDAGASSGVSSFTASFDWGLPFFLGRKVYVGIEGKSSTLATGPYWAY